MSAKNVNYSVRGKTMLKVMCPDCGSSGAHYTDSYQPKCHVCPAIVYMQPASNDKVECTWNEFIEYIEGKR